MPKPHLAYHPYVGKRKRNAVERLRLCELTCKILALGMALTALASTWMYWHSTGQKSYLPALAAVGQTIVLWAWWLGWPLLVRFWLIKRGDAFWITREEKDLYDLLLEQIPQHVDNDMTLASDAYAVFRAIVHVNRRAAQYGALAAQYETLAAQALRLAETAESRAEKLRTLAYDKQTSLIDWLAKSNEPPL